MERLVWYPHPCQYVPLNTINIHNKDFVYNLRKGSKMPDRIGQQLGKYRLLRLLGRGGFAEVYQGEHIHLKTQVAIKVMQTQLTDDDLEHFLKEAQTIARLEHPHIVRVLYFDMQDNTPFLVMDYAPNGTLRQRYPKQTSRNKYTRQHRGEDLR
jgi:serine/threonine protein kinase